MPVAPFKVKAVYDYKSAEPDDLNFPNGQIITITAEEDEEWYAGEYVDAAGKKMEGIFPKNFVEKYEPEIPLRPNRPTRAKKDADPTPAVLPTPTDDFQGPEKEEEQAPRSREAEIAPQSGAQHIAHSTAEPPPPTPPTQASVQRSASSAATKPPLQSPKPTTNKPPPPQVAEKPDVGSFKDRMAMFNKAAAAPIAPFKPGGGSSGASAFIKKPFVAPPPSKNAYVLPPREPPPQKIYRREEDPGLAAEQTNEPATVMPQSGEPEAPADEDQPKPTSLKDRIALLQKQQMEQARRAEGALKKEKPKKPARKHTEVEAVAETSDMPSRPSLERIGSGDAVGKKSVDFADDESGPIRGHASRQASVHPGLATPPQPSRELVSDTNDADDDTEEAPDTSAEEERHNTKHTPTGFHNTAHSRQEVQSAAAGGDAEAEEGDDGADEEEGEEEEVDPELRRRMEIRERMAKMSGGMGMMGMFGPAPAMPSAATSRKPKPLGEESGRHVSSGHGQEETAGHAPPVPVMTMPGIYRTKSPEEEGEELESDTEDPPSRATPKGARAPSISQEEIEAPAPPKRSSTGRSAPPVPLERAVPPPPPRDARVAPVIPSRDQAVPEAPTSPRESHSGAPPTPRTERSLAFGEDTDDETSLPANRISQNEGGRPQSKEGLPLIGKPPPLPTGRPGQMSLDTTSPVSPTMNDKRTSRGPPPIPVSSPAVTSPQTRGPPPPPPGQPPSRRSTNDSLNMIATKHQVNDDSEEEVTEYDGDYDTDIVSSAKHKDALKSHGRDSSLDEEGTLTDESQSKPSSADPPGRTAPPLPPTSAPRDVPPLPPQNASKAARPSSEMPRAAPPPVPPPRQPLEEDYDPFRYSASRGKVDPQAAPLQSPSEEVEEDDMYDATPVNTRAVPPPPPPAAERGTTGAQTSAAASQSAFAAPQQSLDINRTKSQARRSMEQTRPSGEHGYIASDIDIAQSSYWWAQENVPPPSLQNRNDILYEIESSTSTKRGGKATISKDVYVLYMDYSQSTITAMYDAAEAHNVTFEQRHERPPPTPRQDQLENASSQYGARIAEAAHSRQNNSVGDSSPNALVLDLIKPLTAIGVLAPIGTRAYGALVYANLANASTQQHDEIRPGDVVTFRNAKFAGHKGTMHAKYATEAGRPGHDHVGVVLDWDGTKKKIRVWEQGRDEAKSGKKGKVHEESYKVGDLKSGEVRVYRVMGRSWVGWDK